MGRKVIIDCDPGIADAVALCLGLFDSRLEVLAATAVAGVVPAHQATANLQAIVDHLDPPRMARVGAAVDLERAPKDTESVFSSPALPAQGADGMGNAHLEVARHHRSHLSEKLIIDEVRANPDQVTVLCLGPLTNLARAFQRDPLLPSMLDRLVIAGGCVPGSGNVTPAAEFNMHYDPEAARAIFQSPTTKTLVPLDATTQVPLHLDIVEELPPETTQAGMLLRRIIPFAFRAHRQGLGTESIVLPEAVAVIALLCPELFETVEMQADIEIRGELTTGATIFDRRLNAPVRANMEVAVAADIPAVASELVRGLKNAGRRQ